MKKLQIKNDNNMDKYILENNGMTYFIETIRTPPFKTNITLLVDDGIIIRDCVSTTREFNFDHPFQVEDKLLMEFDYDGVLL